MSSDKFKKLSQKELNIVSSIYLNFSTNFIEYIKELDPEMYKRAVDYASTVDPLKELKKD